MLKNKVYIGKTLAFTFYEGINRRNPQEEWIEISNATLPVISEKLFLEAQGQLKLNQDDSVRNIKQQYLPRGHLYCRR